MLWQSIKQLTSTMELIENFRKAISNARRDIERAPRSDGPPTRIPYIVIKQLLAVSPWDGSEWSNAIGEEAIMGFLDAVERNLDRLDADGVTSIEKLIEDAKVAKSIDATGEVSDSETDTDSTTAS